MRRFLFLAAALLLVLATTSAVALRWSWNHLNRPFKGYAPTERIVVIEPGASGSEIVSMLANEGVLPDSYVVNLYVRLVLSPESLKAGEYRFEGPVTPLQVFETIAEARVLTRQVTIREGLTLEETAQELSNAGFGSLDGLLEAMRSPALISDLDPAADDLEGYLFPDTYAFSADISESEVVATLVDNARRKLQRLERRPTDLELNTRELVTLASIVEKEVSVESERALVAGVYANRLRQGMGLYADPTVIFALKKSGKWDGNLRRPDLQLDSPYNTYRYRGLPPGPICSPGLASLVAAGRPADVAFLYFVSRNDGTHVFAKTLAEHNRNVYTWQKKYWQDKWSQRRSVEDSTDSSPPVQ